jgi:chaperonin GroEL (HSP60 family)
MSNETKIISKQNEVFEVIKSAVNKMVDLIKSTYGPAGNKIIISKLTHRIICDDGVQAARDFELSDSMENSIVNIIREVAVKTND